MPTICGSPQVPREVRMMTKKRNSGSAPKKEVKAPWNSVPAAVVVEREAPLSCTNI